MIMSSSVGMLAFPRYGKIIQMFQTTHQSWIILVFLAASVLWRTCELGVSRALPRFKTAGQSWPRVVIQLHLSIVVHLVNVDSSTWVYIVASAVLVAHCVVTILPFKHVAIESEWRFCFKHTCFLYLPKDICLYHQEWFRWLPPIDTSSEVWIEVCTISAI